MSSLLRQHSQASNWLERSLIRRDIKRGWRAKLKAQRAERTHQLSWTGHGIDNYRMHALAAAQRQNDPRVDEDRRRRDADALARHYADKRDRILGNEHLTEVEKGIALDGLDAATVFPEYKPGELFSRAHKVRGIEALRYRAQVARARDTAGFPRPLPRPMPHVDAGSRSRDEQLERLHTPAPDGVAAAVDDRKPFVALVGPADVIHLEEHEYASVPHQDRDRLQRFATREQAYEWTLAQLDTYRTTSSRAGQDFTASIRELGRSNSSQIVSGPLGMVTDEVRGLYGEHQRRQDHARQADQPQACPAGQPPDTSAAQDRFADIERRLSEITADRDRLSNRVGILQRGLDAVTADRDEVNRKLANANGQIEALKNRNLRMAAEIEELRQQPNVDRVAAERDRYKRERDEAVTKLAQQTPREQRYGSRERAEFDKLGNTERWSRQTETADDPQARADAAAREEYGRAIAEQMSADFAKVHGDIYDEPKLREFAREWLTNAAEQHREQKTNGTERNGQQRNGTERSR
ncbi:hypothetical protein [Nocardia sp. NPDC052316]|uniref:hypothetical protein n=1 Tax=Nocardia sp. NPDC052316 TaxID=3364329 RepID=UPI0037C54620